MIPFFHTMPRGDVLLCPPDAVHHITVDMFNNYVLSVVINGHSAEYRFSLEKEAKQARDELLLACVRYQDLMEE